MGRCADDEQILTMIAEAKRLTALSMEIAARHAKERLERQAAQRRQQTVHDAARELLYGKRKSG